MVPNADHFVGATGRYRKDPIHTILGQALHFDRVKIPPGAAPRQLVIVGGWMERNKEPGRVRPVLNVIDRFVSMPRYVHWPIIVHRKGQQFVQMLLPVIVHIMPAAAKRDRENFFFEEILSQGEVEIVPA